MSSRHPRVSSSAVLLGLNLGMGLAIAGPLAAGEPVTESFTPAADSTMFDNGGTSNGAGPNLYAGVTNGGGGFTVQRSPMRFDLSGIPADATILEVSLVLTLVQSGSQAQDGDPFELRRVNAPWGEAGSVANGGLGGPAQPGDATWNFSFFPDVAWKSPGGDLAPDISAALGIGTAGGSAWTFTDAPMVADVASWIADPASNHGWALMSGDEASSGSARRFGSREGAPSQQPTLHVTWEAGAAPCVGDLDESGAVDFNDLLTVLAAFGPCDACPEDLDGSGAVDFNDLLALLANFGPCDG